MSNVRKITGFTLDKLAGIPKTAFNRFFPAICGRDALPFVVYQSGTFKTTDSRQTEGPGAPGQHFETTKGFEVETVDTTRGLRIAGQRRVMSSLNLSLASCFALALTMAHCLHRVALLIGFTNSAAGSLASTSAQSSPSSFRHRSGSPNRVAPSSAVLKLSLSEVVPRLRSV